MARARLPHCCDNNDDEDEVSRKIGFDITDVSIQVHKVSGLNSNCFIFKLLLLLISDLIITNINNTNVQYQ